MIQQSFKTFMEQQLDIEFGKRVQTRKHTQLSVLNNSNIYVLYILENTKAITAMFKTGYNKLQIIPKTDLLYLTLKSRDTSCPNKKEYFLKFK